MIVCSQSCLARIWICSCPYLLSLSETHVHTTCAAALITRAQKVYPGETFCVQLLYEGQR